MRMAEKDGQTRVSMSTQKRERTRPMAMPAAWKRMWKSRMLTRMGPSMVRASGTKRLMRSRTAEMTMRAATTCIQWELFMRWEKSPAGPVGICLGSTGMKLRKALEPKRRKARPSK